MSGRESRPTLSAVDTARELGVNERTVRRWIAAGRLQAERVHQKRFAISLDAAKDVRRDGSAAHAAALRDALDTLREVGYEADADEIVRRYGL